MTDLSLPSISAPAIPSLSLDDVDVPDLGDIADSAARAARRFARFLHVPGVRRTPVLRNKMIGAVLLIGAIAVVVMVFKQRQANNDTPVVTSAPNPRSAAA